MSVNPGDESASSPGATGQRGAAEGDNEERGEDKRKDTTASAAANAGMSVGTGSDETNQAACDGDGSNGIVYGDNPALQVPDAVDSRDGAGEPAVEDPNDTLRTAKADGAPVSADLDQQGSGREGVERMLQQAQQQMEAARLVAQLEGAALAPSPPLEVPQEQQPSDPTPEERRAEVDGMLALARERAAVAGIEQPVLAASTADMRTSTEQMLAEARARMAHTEGVVEDGAETTPAPFSSPDALRSQQSSSNA